MRWSVFWVQKAPNLKQLTHAHTPPKPTTTTTTTTTTRTTTTATTTKAKTTTRFASEGLRLARISQFARVAGSARRFPNILEVSALSAIKTSQNTHPTTKTPKCWNRCANSSNSADVPLGHSRPGGPSNALERPRTPSNGPSRALECPRTALEPHFGQILKIWKLCWLCETKPCLHVFGHKLSRCRQNVWTLVGLSRNHSFIHCCGLCGLPGFHRDHLVWFGCKMREI